MRRLTVATVTAAALMGSLLLLGGVGVAAAQAAAATPLTGETLDATPGSAYDAQGNCSSSAECFQATGTCNPSATSTVSFTAAGDAVGPYPGTFTASGTVTFGAQTQTSFTGVVPSPAGPNISLTENFTIRSGTTTITGKKKLAANVISFVPNTGLGACATSSAGYSYEDEASATYTATINAPTGSSSQTGSTELNFGRSSTTDCGSAAVCNYGNFSEAFYTATAVPTCNQNSQGNQNQDGDDQGCSNQ